MLLAVSRPSASEQKGCALDVPASRDEAANEVLRRVPAESAAAVRSDGFAFLADQGWSNTACGGLSHALVVFNRPVPDVMHLLQQTHRQGEYLTNLHRVRGIRHGERESVVEHTIKILFTKVVYRVVYRWSEEESRIWWSLDPSFDNMPKSIEGHWQLYRLAHRKTLAIYATRVDVGPMLPRRLQRALTQRNIRQAIRNIRLWVDSNGEVSSHDD